MTTPLKRHSGPRRGAGRLPAGHMRPTHGSARRHDQALWTSSSIPATCCAGRALDAASWRGSPRNLPWRSRRHERRHAIPALGRRAPRECCRRPGGRGAAMASGTGRRAHQSAEDAHAPDVWPGTSRSAGPTLFVGGVISRWSSTRQHALAGASCGSQRYGLARAGRPRAYNSRGLSNLHHQNWPRAEWHEVKLGILVVPTADAALAGV
jgi:hypothetical protein